MVAVVYLPEAEQDLAGLPPREQVAVVHVVDKLEALGAALPYPHSSAVRAADDLRELRPRGGRSPWRVFYRQVGQVFVIAAVGPEAQHDHRGFARSVHHAQQRLEQLEEDPP